MEQPRVIGHVVAVSGFRLKVELSPDSKSSSRATPDGVQRAVAINSFLTFDLGAGTHAIGSLSDLEARESYDPTRDNELSLELMKPRRIASVQLLGTVRQSGNGKWKFDTGITVLPTLDTPAEVANPDILAGVFEHPPLRNRPQKWADGEFDFALELGHQTGDENTRISASFNDLFSRPLAIVGNTGSGKSYTVASLLRSVVENEHVSIVDENGPHIFILDINGEYANAFLDEDARNYIREPNEAYINGRKLAVPIWLMNSEEVCEWLSASEQTQQPVLKAWWAFLKGRSEQGSPTELDFLGEALASIQQMYPLSQLTKNMVRARCLAVKSFLSSTDIDLDTLREAIRAYFVKDEKGQEKNFYAETVTNPMEIDAALRPLISEIEKRISAIATDEQTVHSGDTPSYFSRGLLSNTATLASAASHEEASQIDQHLTTLRMRLKTRLADRRWSVFTNYDQVGITSTRAWFESLGFVVGGSRVSILDLSMLSHEVLPFICSVVGRVLLEAREKLPASQRYSNPWVLVLEEAHNYARPVRQGEDRGQALSRKAFERVAKEGRKFGLSLIVASQRPSEISPTIISQCANFFSHRLQNPDDIDHFKRIIPRQAQRLLDQVTVLASGEAIVFGSAVHIPTRVQIKRPKYEPWSATAAPFVDWSGGNAFPLMSVIENWGITNERNPAGIAAEADHSDTPLGDSDVDDEIPF
ncbi:MULTISPECIES: ATP-binding protein [Thalassospira]|uniref:ATP-binding protein n=1 Tax=Thalassospira TaxID=168934 RepID=UPI000A002F44|nr:MULTISPECIES: ATP-binding protein [Thalassospira]